jgi:hypothetical protein
MPCIYSNRPNNLSDIHEDVSLKFTDKIKLSYKVNGSHGCAEEEP